MTNPLQQPLSQKPLQPASPRKAGVEKTNQALPNEQLTPTPADELTLQLKPAKPKKTTPEKNPWLVPLLAFTSTVAIAGVAVVAFHEPTRKALIEHVPQWLKGEKPSPSIPKPKVTEPKPHEAPSSGTGGASDPLTGTSNPPLAGTGTALKAPLDPTNPTIDPAIIDPATSVAPNPSSASVVAPSSASNPSATLPDPSTTTPPTATPTSSTGKQSFGNRMVTFLEEHNPLKSKTKKPDPTTSLVAPPPTAPTVGVVPDPPATGVVTPASTIIPPSSPAIAVPTVASVAQPSVVTPAPAVISAMAKVTTLPDVGYDPAPMQALWNHLIEQVYNGEEYYSFDANNYNPHSSDELNALMAKCFEAVANPASIRPKGQKVLEKIGLKEKAVRFSGVGKETLTLAEEKQRLSHGITQLLNHSKSNQFTTGAMSRACRTNGELEVLEHTTEYNTALILLKAEVDRQDIKEEIQYLLNSSLGSVKYDGVEYKLASPFYENARALNPDTFSVIERASLTADSLAKIPVSDAEKATHYLEDPLLLVSIYKGSNVQNVYDTLELAKTAYESISSRNTTYETNLALVKTYAYLQKASIVLGKDPQETNNFKTLAQALLTDNKETLERSIQYNIDEGWATTELQALLDMACPPLQRLIDNDLSALFPPPAPNP